MNGYELSRKWFDFAFENPDKIKPTHGILYFFIIEHCNRLGWKRKFGLPSTMAKDAIGIRSYNTYIKTLSDLVEWGFVELVEKSKNQYSSNIVALSNFDKAHDKALDKALMKHSTKQCQSTVQSIDSIDKQLNNKQINNKQEGDINFENPLKDYIDSQPPKKYNDDHTKLALDVCDYLNVPTPRSGNVSTAHFREVQQFIENLHGLGQLDHFKVQFKYYKIAWDATNLEKHNYKNFIGSYEQNYEDGKWCSQNWQKKAKPEPLKMTTTLRRYE